MIGKSVSHYRILDKLGAGGMGEVYRAHDTTLDRQVAIKVLPDIFSGDPERLARFEREAKLLASLNHPNIATIYGLEQTDGKRFLVMELVEGETLAQRIATGPLPVEEALEVCRQIADGLDAAHERGVIHRDLKPANIKITPEGKVKILDFGLAKALQDEAPAADASKSPTLTDQMTRAGVILGTAAYMSPEQARGGAVDKRTDIWAFGVILFELLTGRSCFPGDTVTDVLAAVVKSEPDWTALPAGTPDSVRQLLRRCLTKDRKQRLRDIGDACIQMEESLLAPASAPAAIPHPVWRRAMPWAVGVLAGALIAGFAVWKWHPVTLPSKGVAHLSMMLPKDDEFGDVRSPGVALSPDGSRLAYVGRHRGGQQQLFLRIPATLETKPIAGTDGAEAPFFSPDGKWIGFFAQGKLKKVSVTGGSTQVLCDAVGFFGASWGEDGTIFFAPQANSGLWKVSSSGGQPQRVTTLDRSKGEISHRWPQVLPGGKAILFTVWIGPGNDERQVQVFVLQTGERRVLVQGGHTGRYVPTGHLVYAHTGMLLALPFDLGRLAVTSESLTPLIEGIIDQSEGAQYAVSTLGTLAYVADSPHSRERRLLWVDRFGKQEALPLAAQNYYLPRISPDGRRFAVNIEGGTFDVWISDFSRPALTRLTSEGASQDPIWTPEGKRITYRGTKLGLRNLYWKAVDGTGAEERLTTSEELQTPGSWSSPDGRWLAYESANALTGSDLWLLPFGDAPSPSAVREGERKPQVFLRTQAWECAPMISPDGNWIAYYSDQSGQYEVYVQPFPRGGERVQISTKGGREPVWARNGRELFYLNGAKMMSVEITTQPGFSAGSPRLLFEGNFVGSTMNARYDVSPDGQRFLLVQSVAAEEVPTKIEVVLNWFEELKQKVLAAK